MNDLKFALRQLLKNPVFTTVAVVTLALGIGLNGTAFSVINAVFLQTIRGVEQPDRVVFASERVSYPAYLRLKEGSHTLSGLAAARGTVVTIQWDDQMLQHHVPTVSDNYFAMMGVRPLLGRFFEPSPSRQPAAMPEVVLDFQFWRRRLGGDPAAIGKALFLNGKGFAVIGVCPEPFHGAGPERPLFWVPLGCLPLLEASAAEWGDLGKRSYALFGRLRPGSSLAEAQAEFRVLLAGEPGLAPTKPMLLGVGREVWTGGTSVEKQAEFLLVTVVPLVAVGTILAIACSNVANLLLARAVGRRREIAIRLATGASRWRVLRLLLIESLLLALAGGALGLLISAWTVDFVLATFAEFASLAVSVDGRVIAYTAAISLGSTLVFGMAPALRATRTDVASALKSEGGGSLSGRRDSRLRSLFLVTQIAGSMALLVVTTSFVRSILKSRMGESARQMDRLVVARLPESPLTLTPSELQRQVRELVGTVPGVKSVTLLEADQGGSARLLVAGAEDRTNAPVVSVQRVDAAYFQVIGATLLRGKGIEPTPAGAKEEGMVVVNEAAAKQFWPGQDALGQRFGLGAERGLLVGGVVGDQDGARVYRAFSDTLTPKTALVLTEVPAAQLVAPIRQRLLSLASERAFPQVGTLREVQFKTLDEITRVAVLLGTVALALAATGLYGSMAFSASQRTREMGIRLALGATRGEVVRLFLGHGFRISGAGGLLGLAAVWIAFQFMSGLIFGRWTLDWPILTAVALVFAVVTLLACWLPARRAGRVDPMVALRYE